MDNFFGAWHVEAMYCYEQMGRTAEWETLRERIGGFDLEERKAYRAHGLRGYWMVRYRRRQVNDNDAAEIAARVGDTEKALGYLEKTIRARDHRMTQLKVNPIYDPLRSDSRFLELLRRMNLAS